MSKELYFIPIIERALASDSPETELVAAFREIQTLGKREEYRAGFKNFQYFISTIVLQNENGQDASILHPRNMEEGLEELRKQVPDSLVEPLDHLEINLKCDKQTIYSCTLSDSTPQAHVDRIKPGGYTIELSNGQVIWNKQLDASLLIEETPASEDYLPLAAKTDDARYEESLLGGDLLLNISPGDTGGKIVIRIARKG